jgi:exodeoxyribonuclease VII large subunit
MTMDLFSSAGKVPAEEKLPGDEPKQKIYSVAEITRQIKFLVEESFPILIVEGELSNLTRHSSGHIYFTLKDEHAQIKCVIWRMQASQIGCELNDGMKILVKGKLSVYEKGGSYQITVSNIQPAGIGELQLALEQLKKKLFDEGLFDEAHKKPLPEFPISVGIITSPTGAAIRDIVSVARRRMPSVTIILAPVKVQGAGAAAEIAQAIEDFNRYRNVDVLIVGRGGGSLEDMWAFNEEKVARAIFNSAIPIVSAVGHEIDFTIADLVADVRAATPSAAAELVIPDQIEIRQRLADLRHTLAKHVAEKIEAHRATLEQLEMRYGFRQPGNLIAEYRQQADDLERQLHRCILRWVDLQKQKSGHLEKRLQALNPRNTLKRGYTITRQNNQVIQRAAQFSQSENTEIEFYDGLSEIKKNNN